MKLLMITPRVDKEHDIFGFIHRWVEELSKRVEHLDVITFGIGKTNLENNVNLYSSYSKYQPIKLLKLNKLLLKLVPKSDIVFSHMYPWVPIVVAPYAKLFRKPVVMWNTHGHVNLRKRVSLALVNKVVTASKKSFNIKTKKKIVIGHGIDVKKFRSVDKKGCPFEMLSLGRISRVKGYDLIIKAIGVLVNKRGYKLKIEIAGPVYDRGYYEELNIMVKALGLDDHVIFLGSIPFSKVDSVYKKSSIFISASETGSLDKSILEAMAVGLPVLTCNKAFLDISDSEMKSKCYFEKGKYFELADKIEHFLNCGEKNLRNKLRNIVVKNNSLETLTENLVKVFRAEVRK